jgi:phosphoglycolate phosphatase
MLEALVDLGLRIGVVSNKNGRFLRQEAAHLGWERLIDRLVGANDATADKPSAAPVLLALQPTGIAPGPQVWFVGDAAVDMECALNAGCTPILMRGERPRDGEFDGAPPRRHLAGCDDFLGLTRELLVPISPN